MRYQQDPCHPVITRVQWTQIQTEQGISRMYKACYMGGNKLLLLPYNLKNKTLGGTGPLSALLEVREGQSGCRKNVFSWKMVSNAE